MKEHKDATRLAHTEKSAIAQHVHEQAEPHDIDWQSWSVIDCGRGQTERKVREALHIKLRKPELNRDKGNKKASIPPRAEPGTMQLHTTRPAD